MALWSLGFALRSLALLGMVWVAVGGSMPGSAQVGTGATLTVLRGQVSVLRADGTPIAPASTGLVLGVGDQISTGDRAGALVTFFEGSEVELGSETAIVIKEATGQGTRTNITIASIVGATIHRVVTLTDGGSSYRVESGGTVGLVRGTVFGHYADFNGDVVAALLQCDAPASAPLVARTACLEFPFEGSRMQVGTKVTYTARGNKIEERFRITEPLFNVITDLPNELRGTDNEGRNTGSELFPEQISLRPRESSDENTATVTPTVNPCQPPTPGRTVLVAPAGSGGTVLQVQCQDGFQVGDTIRVNANSSPSELTTIRGFGSFIVDPLQNSYSPGALILKESVATATRTPSPTNTPTPTSTATQTPTPTLVTLSIASLALDEGSGAIGTTAFNFGVTLSGPAPGPVAVNYAPVAGAPGPGVAVGGGTCAGGVDFLSTGGTVNFATGVQAGSAPVQVCADYDLEVAETFTVTLSGVTGPAALGVSSATGTIRDDDGCMLSEGGLPRAQADDSGEPTGDPIRLGC